LPYTPKEPAAMSAAVKDVMTTHVVAVKMDTSFKELATRLRQHRVSAFPVVDDDGRVVGVVDVLSVYNCPDAGIQQEIQELVRLNQAFVPSDRFTVSVRNGVVTLEGHLEDADSGRAIVADAWHVEGVVSVRDRLDYPPTSYCEEI
jgi:CBS-domain-containing membrane protein